MLPRVCDLLMLGTHNVYKIIAPFGMLRFIYLALAVIWYGKGTSFTKLKGHRLHFLASNLKKKSDYYALERHNDYGTKD